MSKSTNHYPDYRRQTYPPQQWQPGQPAYTPVAAPAPLPAKHRIAHHIWRNFFRYCFFAVQAIFLIWLISAFAASSGNGADAHAQAVQWCADKSNWQYLYHSQADCVTHYGNGLNAAGDIGSGIAVGLIIGLWVAADIILGIGRIVVMLGRRAGGHRELSRSGKS